MAFDFDNTVDRRGTDSVKWNKDALKAICSNEDALAFWVADMDFKTEEHIKATAEEAAADGVFGYAVENDITGVFTSWAEKRHEWKIEKEKTVFVNGLLHGIALSVDTFTKKGDGLLIPSPTYRPFREIARDSERIMVDMPLKREKDGTFSMDRDLFRSKLDESDAVLFCSPHNPSGLVFSESELKFILKEAKRQNKIVISDEIHADLVHPNAHHIPMGKANEKIGASVITFMAPSKTFNVAGEHSGFAVFSDKAMLDEFKRRQKALRVTSPGYMIKQLLCAAYSEGYEYNKALCEYLAGTASEMKSYLEKECPEIKMANSEASFVTFLNMSACYKKIEERVMSNAETYPIADGGGVLSTFFGISSGICMNDGTWFGPEYKEYVRINYGTSRALVMDALERIVKAVKAL